MKRSGEIKESSSITPERNKLIKNTEVWVETMIKPRNCSKNYKQMLRVHFLLRRQQMKKQ